MTVIRSDNDNQSRCSGGRFPAPTCLSEGGPVRVGRPSACTSAAVAWRKESTSMCKASTMSPRTVLCPSSAALRRAAASACLLTALFIGSTPACSADQQPGWVMAWGKAVNGYLGSDPVLFRPTAGHVLGMNGVTEVSASLGYCLAVRRDGTVWAWGRNHYGTLGNGTTTGSEIPVQVGSLTGATGISAGNRHGLALMQDGTVWAWGENTKGQLGDGTTTNRLTPVQVAGLTDVVSVAAGGQTSLALRSDGTVWAWGSNDWGALGNGAFDNAAHPAPAPVPGLAGVTAVAAGQGADQTGFVCLALRFDGTAWAWGLNYYGQLGTGQSYA
ncbi:MAG: hypothetical protein FJX72_11705, partial [Armatimonadetes bacterium]|nr:hypothetical protein [Armatimonadota bacterium]